MTITRLIYASQPFGFDDAMLGGILVQARRNNARAGITGCLIARADLYLQLLEGPADALDQLYDKIARDDRHLQVERLFLGEVEAQLFPDWAMRDDPARSWLWSAEEVADGALRRASGDELEAVFVRVLKS